MILFASGGVQFVGRFTSYAMPDVETALEWIERPESRPESSPENAS